MFHHAQGQTTGFRGFADQLRAAGHIVHAPDLYGGRTFSALDAAPPAVPNQLNIRT